MNEFQFQDVERITGVKRIRLHQWIEAGFLTPSIKLAAGHGTRHVWSRFDLYKIVLFKRLVESGLHRNAAAKLITIDFEEVNKQYREEKKRGGPGEFWLVIARRWKNGHDEEIESFGYPWRSAEALGLSLADMLGEINEISGWIDVIIINVTKLAEVVDSTI